MAALLGEAVGQTVGFRVRLEACVGRATRIEVVTEGILLRRLQQVRGSGCEPAQLLCHQILDEGSRCPPGKLAVSVAPGWPLQVTA